MVELKGKYNSCKVFTDNIDNETISQVINLLNQESVKNSVIRIMPDTHAGAGCVIGTTMTIGDKIIPNLVGVDIGCGMLAVKLKENRIDFSKLDNLIRKNVPAGFAIRDTAHKYINNTKVEDLFAHKANAINLDRAEKSLGTLGGGNHFIEVDKDTDGYLWLVIHTGSRNLGKQVAEYYQNAAWEKLRDGNRSELIQKKIKELKTMGKETEIEKAIKKIKNTAPVIPRELAYCEGELFAQYIHDMKITQEYAFWNREAIADIIVKEMNLHEVDRFQTIHNYVDTEKMILRKGAISCQKGEKVIIPINMRDGSLICVGKGNIDWNFSGPHGAGRLFSRSEAKRKFTVSEFAKTMKDAEIFTTSVGNGTLDESPMAYKPMAEIIKNIKDTVEIIQVIKPVYNFKASAD